MTNLNDLSERELEILQLVATGKSNKEIAQALHISTNTVKVHLRNIFAKLEVSSRTEASLYILQAQKQAEPEPDEPHQAFPEPVVADQHQDAQTRSVHLRPWQWVVLGISAVAVLLGLGAGLSRAFQPAPTPTAPAQSAFPDPSAAANRWEARAQMPSARSSMAVAFYENAIYVIGGENEQGVLSDVFLYQPETDIWQSSTPKPTAVADVQAAVIGGKIFVPGGRLPSGEVTDVLEIYNLREDTWETGARLPIPLSAYALVAFEGQLYLFGGWDGQNFVDTALNYNPNLDTWTTMTALPSKRGYSGAAVAGGKIFVFGGFDGQQALATNFIYLPDLDRAEAYPWKEAAPLPEGRYAMGVATIADVIYLIGGQGGEGSTFSQMEYFPVDDRWQINENPLAETWSNLGVVPYGTQLYAMGGLLDGQPTGRNLVYQVLFVVVIPVVR